VKLSASIDTSGSASGTYPNAGINDTRLEQQSEDPLDPHRSASFMQVFPYLDAEFPNLPGDQASGEHISTQYWPGENQGVSQSPKRARGSRLGDIKDKDTHGSSRGPKDRERKNGDDGPVVVPENHMRQAQIASHRIHIRHVVVSHTR